ncbi:ParB N-terminal domain-containing protein [Streptomyces sp. DH8]|uniref:ParB N-terminal domain-containing protein n=1 Tax=Streptomyces sp. DH8 TaxID=2857008 RepID=UPI0035B1A383
MASEHREWRVVRPPRRPAGERTHRHRQPPAPRAARALPLNDQPIACVVWVKADEFAGNAYNPNHVADPRMELLWLSTRQNGCTQPIVAWPVEGDDGARYEVADGFGRHSETISKRAFRPGRSASSQFG